MAARRKTAKKRSAPKKRPKTKKRKRGRPTTYSKAKGEKIIAEVAGGRSLWEICHKEAWAPTYNTAQKWLNRYWDTDFGYGYAEAVEHRARMAGEICIGLAHKTMLRSGRMTSQQVAAARLLIDTHKWAAAHMLPKRWGKLAQEGDVQEGFERIEDDRYL